MKKISIFFLIVIFLVSCNVIQGWQSFAIQEPNGRAYLKDMKFKKSFKSEMANYIDEKSIYILEREPSENISRYVILRFFKTGQWIRYVSNEYPKPSLVNDLKKGAFIGYYNFKNDKILTEEPNFNFSNSGKSNIHSFIVKGDFIEQIKTPFKDNPIYKKTKIDNLEQVIPDW
jgi:hypothetical protein